MFKFRTANIAFLLSLVWNSLFSSKAFAQSVPLFQLKPKLHLLPIINPQRHYLQGSLEVLIKNRIGIEFGYGRRFAETTGAEQSAKPFGESMMIEANYYLKPFLDKRRFRMRLLGGLSIRKVVDIHNKQFHYNVRQTDGGSVYQEENVGIHKTLTIYGTRVGIEFEFMKKMGIALFVEPGLKYKHQYYMNSLLADDENASGAENGGDYLLFSEVPYDGYLPNVNVGARFFWSFSFKSEQID